MDVSQQRVLTKSGDERWHIKFRGVRAPLAVCAKPQPGPQLLERVNNDFGHAVIINEAAAQQMSQAQANRAAQTPYE
ncbi:MAG: hypothetical protein K0U93_26420 [Gammaproteobacteria bacterium]|nr:hypothetical protein [Gammaproteobacteria bacterium]